MRSIHASRVFVTALSLIATAPLQAQDRVTGKAFATRSPVIAQHGMVATSQPLATQIGLRILSQGGNAIDAAIAANAALGLMEPTGCGMGGDLFAIVWDAKTKTLHGLNASGRSPKSLTAEELKRRKLKKIPSLGPLPVSVPGCVDGWFELHGKFGKLGMKEILTPAIDYATNGFPVSQLIAYYWQRSAPVLSRYPGFRDQMTRDGRGPKEGELWTNPNLARTLSRIAEGGRDEFYRGSIAREIADFMKKNAGFLSLEDLEAHTSTWVEPVSCNYRGVDLWELPPNGQGIAALQILEILEGYDIAKWGRLSGEYVHHFVEAKKLAFADRAKFYADPDFSDVPVEQLISEDYARTRRARIRPNRAARSVPAGNLGHGDTIYLCTADSMGNMVSLIQSNYRGMGSGMTPTGLGFVLQDRGELFDLEPGRANSYAPGKRPFHTIIPAFLTQDGEPLMAFGVMGGATQPQAHAQIVINMVDFGMNVQEAGDAPRILHSGSSQPTGETMSDGGYVQLEQGLAGEWELVRSLLGRRHDVRWNRGAYGGYQAIWRNPETGFYHGASESRKDGQAAGF